MKSNRGYGNKFQFESGAKTDHQELTQENESFWIDKGVKVIQSKTL